MPGTLAQILATKADLVNGKVKTEQLPATVGGNGLSAYEVAVANGFIGTEEEWLLSLKGDKGDKGDTGDKGLQGDQGIPGNDGASGANGADGYTPVKGVDYFDGVKGDKGDKGDQGDQGIQGLPGSDADVTVHESTYVHANIATAYSHSQSTHAPTNAQKNSDITKAEIEAKLTGEISTHTHAGGSGTDPWTVIKLAQDFVSSSSSNVNVTNFYFTPAINKTYLIFGYFLLRTATATVGARPGVAWPANLTDATVRVEAANSLTASALQLFGARTTKNAASTGLATTTESHWGSLDGIMITSGTTSGNFQITIASETAGTNVTMKAGSILMYREL